MPSFNQGGALPHSTQESSHRATTQPYVLVGPLGLRAGWCLLLYFILTAALGFALFFAIAGGTGKLAEIRAEVAATRAAARQSWATGAAPVAQPERLGVGAIPEVSETGAVLLAALGLSYLERRRFAVYGLPERRLRDLAPGALWGLAAMGILVGGLRASHLLVFDRQLLHGGSAAKYGFAWLAFFLLVGIFEEFLFRGYIQFTLMRGLLGLARRIAPTRERLVAFWLSALVWSCLFFIGHMTNSGENPTGLVSVFLAGILFSYALWQTGSLWWGIGFHMTWDWSQSFLYGVPDSGTLSQGRLFATHATGRVLLSGGVDGPEGSLFVLPVVLLMFVVLYFHRSAEQPSVDPQQLEGKLSGSHRLESESA